MNRQFGHFCRCAAIILVYMTVLDNDRDRFGDLFQVGHIYKDTVAVVVFDKAVAEYTIDQLFSCAVGLEVDASLGGRTFRLAKSAILDQQVIGGDDTEANRLRLHRAAT